MRQSLELDPNCPVPADVARLRALVQQFVRSFGLLVTRETPCGQPVAPSYAHALMVLLERSGTGEQLSQAELGAALGIDKSNVARLCSRMVAAQHATQTVAPADARSRLLALTPKGARLAQRIEQASRERFIKISEGIAPAKRSALFESLALLNAALEGLREEAVAS